MFLLFSQIFLPQHRSIIKPREDDLDEKHYDILSVYFFFLLEQQGDTHTHTSFQKSRESQTSVSRETEVNRS